MVRPWLPACDTAQAQDAVRAAVARWATGWFGPDHTLRTAPILGSSLRKIEWFGAAGAHAGVLSTDIAKLGLAAAGGHGELANRRDKAVFEQLGQQIWQSLAPPFCWDGNDGASVPGANAVPGPKDACFAVTSRNGGWALYLALDQTAIVMARRGVERISNRPALGSIRDAISTERCILSGHLGRASLSSSELASLTKGDVIMLDLLRTKPVPLLVNYVNPEQGTAYIESNTGALRVNIDTPISLQTRSSASS